MCLLLCGVYSRYSLIMPVLMMVDVVLSADVDYSGTWRSAGPARFLPRANSHMAIGQWNGSIFLIGL